jgi:nucleotide-binding universal stress UspA family protein
MTETSASQSRIVVGVDGSPGSRDAVRWAAQQARLTGAALDAVIAWQYPAFFGWAPVSPADADFAKIAEDTLNGTLTEVFGTGWPGWVHPQVSEGYPAEVLVKTAEGADLLVVGCRGYSGLADALLGSVSTYCVHHATVPVTVIRPATREPQRDPN